jgi:F-type H+-transporting ATPase subunit b
MRNRAILAIALGLALASYALPQEAAPAKENPASQSDEAGEGGSWIWWKWANFAILAVGLGYLIGKNVPPLFRKQSDEIQNALAEAAKVKQDAALYATDVETRLANLQKEIEALRQSAHADMTAESERMRRETEHHLERVQEQAVQEIALMTRAAKDELRKYAAQLAIDLAEQRIRALMTPATEDKLVKGFLRDLHQRQAAN